MAFHVAFPAQSHNVIWIKPAKPIVGNLDDVMALGRWRNTFVFQAVMAKWVLRSKSRAHQLPIAAITILIGCELVLPGSAFLAAPFRDSSAVAKS